MRPPNVKDAIDNNEDPVEYMLKKQGCLELHYAVQECIASTQDWRKCQNEVTEFKKCIEKSRMTK